jgi:hypothetical protein
MSEENHPKKLFAQESMTLDNEKMEISTAENVGNKIHTLNRSLTYLDQIYEEIGSSFNFR